MWLQTDTKDKSTGGNSSYPQVAVTWLIEGTCNYKTFVRADSLVLRNRHLRVAANRYVPYYDNPQTDRRQ